MNTPADQAGPARPTVQPAKPKARPTKGIFSKVSISTYTLLKEKFPGCSDGQAAVRAIEAALGIITDPDAFQGHKHFTCTHRPYGLAVPGLNRTHAARLISGVGKADLAKMSRADKKNLGTYIDVSTLQKEMKRATETGEEFKFNGWVVTDDRETGR
jgi:hypothetical protein